MKSVFRIKYKLHHLLNIAFYLIFFILGFLLGGGFFGKIENFEKISDIFNMFI